MIEFIKKYGIGFLLSAIIMLPLSYVTATTISARNVYYDGTNTESSLTDVQAAIEKLYAMSEPKITFTINGTAYQASPNMMWKDWVTSRYNNSNAVVADYPRYLKINNNIIFTGTPGGYIHICLDDLIIDSYSYLTCNNNCGAITDVDCNYIDYDINNILYKKLYSNNYNSNQENELDRLTTIIQDDDRLLEYLDSEILANIEQDLGSSDYYSDFAMYIDYDTSESEYIELSYQKVSDLISDENGQYNDNHYSLIIFYINEEGNDTFEYVGHMPTDNNYIINHPGILLGYTH